MRYDRRPVKSNEPVWKTLANASSLMHINISYSFNAKTHNNTQHHIHLIVYVNSPFIVVVEVRRDQYVVFTLFVLHHICLLFALLYQKNWFKSNFNDTEDTTAEIFIRQQTKQRPQTKLKCFNNIFKLCAM